MNKRFFLILLTITAGSLFANEGITGLWKTVDDKTGEVKSILTIYENQNKVFGRILVIFENGVVVDNYLEPKERAKEVKGSPYYCGLDIIWNMEQKGSKWKKGKILDPEEGKVYSCEIWKKGEDLIVRGKIGPFGRNQTWKPMGVEDLPSGIVAPQNISPNILY